MNMKCTYTPDFKGERKNKNKKNLQPSTMTFSAASQPFFSYQYCVYQQGKPKLRKLIFNCACSHENGEQKLIPGTL